MRRVRYDAGEDGEGECEEIEQGKRRPHDFRCEWLIHRKDEDGKSRAGDEERGCCPSHITQGTHGTHFSESVKFEVISDVPQTFHERWFPSIQFDGFDVSENLVYQSCSCVFILIHVRTRN